METSEKMDGTLARNLQAIDHIALAVRDLEASIEWYTKALGFSLIERRVSEGKTGGMMSAVVKAGCVTIVLLQGTNPDSQISRFVENYGPGLHHLAVRVSDIEEVVSGLEASGLEFDTPIVGEAKLRQAFSHRDENSRLKLELIERHVEGFESANMSKLLHITESKGTF